jgi:hypothetical protein
MRLTTRLAGVRDADAGAGNTAQYELAAAAPPPSPSLAPPSTMPSLPELCARRERSLGGASWGT